MLLYDVKFHIVTNVTMLCLKTYKSKKRMKKRQKRSFQDDQLLVSGVGSSTSGNSSGCTSLPRTRFL